MELEKFKRVPNYIKRFGLFNGMRFFFQIEKSLKSRSNNTRNYNIPELAYPLYLRDCVGDHAIFWQCFVKNQYDIRQHPQYSRLLDFYKQCLDAGVTPLIIDCGANIGLSTLALHQMFPNADVIAVEPNNANFELLQENTAHLSNIHPVRGGVWDKSTHLQIINPDGAPTTFIVEEVDQENRNTLRAYTIDELCDMAGSNHALMIVKIDIEGSQKNLFRSNTEWVARTKLVSLELDDWLFPWQGTSFSFFTCMSRHRIDYILGGESIFCYVDNY